MISFENTEIAFSGKSDKDLRRAYMLFRLIGRPWMVRLGKTMTNLALAMRLPIRGIVKRTIFRHFCGGETIEECESRVIELGKFGIGTILDYSVEGKRAEEDLDATSREIIRTAKVASGNQHIPFCVFKVTGVARFGLLEKLSASKELSEEEKQEYLRVVNRVDAICREAYTAETPVFIDAEESWIQPAIDGIADAMMAKYNRQKSIVFNTLQMYRHDRLDFFRHSIEKARKGGYRIGMKIVRGAYMEKERNRAAEKNYPSPIQPDKSASDRDYDEALRLAVDNLDVTAICAGSHNENSALLLTRLMREKGIPANDTRIYFAQLLGMSDHISFNLSNAGYNVAKYVPYGPVREVLPYLIRRAEENTSVKGQTGRELSLIIKERQRRKKLQR
ncbi:MAG TPA: proline dehydrogenase family protein [Flavobacteriales bacterium]|nr:proline dehydrogenase family protein [Flavobacteriales bacterium]HRE95225.1 proline dehydrogenase family protein [Flavobacteriales bacterium]HRJ40206.1 proline dehydrogenase family protein [Flavobacteriales bacterium]